MEEMLEALRDIGDKSAVEPIKKYIATKPNEKIAAIAKRVLIQLDSEDPVTELIALYKTETYEFEQANLQAALLYYPKEARVVEVMASTARGSDIFFLRRDAIYGLDQINTHQSLLTLANLMGTTFPDDLKYTSKMAPKDLNDYFHQMIYGLLKNRTGKDLPPDAEQWKKALANYLPKDESEAANSIESSRP